jgi:hypothetical protein
MVLKMEILTAATMDDKTVVKKAVAKVDMMVVPKVVLKASKRVEMKETVMVE